MADGKIYITISDTRGGSNDVATADAEAKQQTIGGQSKNALGLMAFNKFINFAEGQANQYVNYTVGNIGNFTGNYQAQKDAEFGLKALNFATNLGISTVGAFVSFGGGIQGGVAAAITATLMIGTEVISNLYRENTEAFNMRRTNRNIALMRERLGLEGLTNGSRSGGY